MGELSWQEKERAKEKEAAQRQHRRLYTQRKKDMSNDRTYGQRKVTPTTDGFPRQHTETKQKIRGWKLIQNLHKIIKTRK